MVSVPLRGKYRGELGYAATVLSALSRFRPLAG